MTRPLPKLGAPARLPHIPLRTEVLPNGLRVAVVERRALPMVDVEVIVRCGAELDAATNAGRFSMLAEMLDEGTSSRGALEIAEEIDYLGAHLDVRAGWDATVVSMRVLSQRLGDALDIVADVVLNASYPVDEFRRKQEERLNALAQEGDEAALLATKALAAGVFGSAHPFGAPLEGTQTSIRSLTREQLVTLHHEHWRAGDAIVLVVGDVSADEIVAQLAARLGAWQRGAATEAAVAAPEPGAARRVLLVDKPGAAQAEVRVGHAAPARSTRDYFPLVVLNTVLGGSFTSRLNTILRERMGVTYGAYSRFRLRRSGGLFSAGAAILTEAAANSAQVIVQEMDRLRSERVGEDELRRAQSYIALGLPRSFETTEDIAAHIHEQLLYELPGDYWERYVDNVLAVTADDVLSVAARHLHPDRCAVVVVADKRHVQGELEQRALGELVPTNVPT